MLEIGFFSSSIIIFKAAAMLSATGFKLGQQHAEPIYTFILLIICRDNFYRFISFSLNIFFITCLFSHVCRN